MLCFPNKKEEKKKVVGLHKFLMFYVPQTDARTSADNI